MGSDTTFKKNVQTWSQGYGKKKLCNILLSKPQFIKWHVWCGIICTYKTYKC